MALFSQQVERLTKLLHGGVRLSEMPVKVSFSAPALNMDRGLLSNPKYREVGVCTGPGLKGNLTRNPTPKINIPIFGRRYPRTWMRRCIKYF